MRLGKGLHLTITEGLGTECTLKPLFRHPYRYIFLLLFLNTRFFSRARFFSQLRRLTEGTPFTLPWSNSQTEGQVQENQCYNLE
jgi:hypothetical protein